MGSPSFKLFFTSLNPSRSAYIALGSNQGDRFTQLRNAVFEIYLQVGEITAISPVYQTPAWGFNGEAFLNACIAVKTRLEPEELMRELLRIETQLGRSRSIGARYENRPIDLDLLLYEDQVLNTELLNLPHPQMHLRDFVLAPLNDLVPDLVHPVLRKPISALEKDCERGEISPISEQLEIPRTYSNNPFNYIAIEGNIGAGKTSFATMVSEDFNGRLILERFRDNPFLPKFYQDATRYAFPLEMSFLADRYQQLSDDLAQYDLFTDFVISDYDVFKSLIFAKITLLEDEFSLYQKLFHLMYKELVKPDLYIYLYQNTDRLLENIKKRGRDYEQNIKPEYLAEINRSYLEFIKSQVNLNVKIIDISHLDFVKNRKDYLYLLEEIWGKNLL